MGRIIQTTLNNKDYLFLFDDDHQVSLIKNINKSIVDTVYKGKIISINEGLKACFVSISKDEKVFLSLEEFNDNIPKCGDELLVQIKTDALKTKLPQGTTNICLPGQYCVCHINGNGISASKKLSKEKQDILISKVKELNVSSLNKHKWVLRTNSEYLLDKDFSPLEEELTHFIEVANFINNEAKYRSLYSIIYAPGSELISLVSDIPYEEYDTIVTDNSLYYEELINSPLSSSKKIVFHDDEYISLKNLHGLQTYLDRALDKKVYLNTGGYIIIEPTEAMTVIDVNSGKSEGRRKDSESFIFKVNKEAAIEIAKQLRIRNLSGIIIIDFINMNNDDNKKNLMDLLEEEFKKDKIKTICVDMTPLGLVEVTRKKISKPLDI